MLPIARAALVLAPLVCSGSLRAASPSYGGTIALKPVTADGKADPSTPAFMDAVSAALTAKGFTIFDDAGHAAWVAQLIVGRTRVGTGLTKDPHAAKIGVGAGVTIPFSTGNSNIVALQRTQLELRISKRGGGVVWDGTAVTVREAGTRTGSDQAVASDLSRAILRDYPTQPKDVIGVP